MMASEKVSEFFSAIRGYHYYRNTWNPEESEVLQCSHELENAFDLFAIKTCKPEGQIVGHLPMEIARVTKFLLDRGAVIIATLNTTNYRRSPLVQGELEIACKVTVRMPGTIKNHMLMDRYLELVRTLYAEPKDELFSDHSCIYAMYHAHQQIMKEERKENVLYQRKNKNQTVIYGQCFYKMREDQKIIQKTDENRKNETIVID